MSELPAEVVIHTDPPGPGHVHDYLLFTYCFLRDNCDTACDDLYTFTVGEWPCHISLLELGPDMLVHHHPVLLCRGGIVETDPAHWGLLNADAEPLPHAC